MQQKTIVWIEDDRDVLRALEEYMREDGFVFKGYRTYKDALSHMSDLRARCEGIRRFDPRRTGHNWRNCE